MPKQQWNELLISLCLGRSLIQNPVLGGGSSLECQSLPALPACVLPHRRLSHQREVCKRSGGLKRSFGEHRDMGLGRPDVPSCPPLATLFLSDGISMSQSMLSPVFSWALLSSCGTGSGSAVPTVFLHCRQTAKCSVCFLGTGSVPESCLSLLLV